MRKLFVPVAATPLAGALMLQSQAPEGGPPAGKGRGGAGPDAVPANVVNTVCASCHTLERVNNKKGDKEAWTATVNRMKDKGADLTDEEASQVVDYLVSTAGSFTIAYTAPDGAAKCGGKAKGKGGGKGGAGFAAKNLKVLTAANYTCHQGSPTPATAPAA